MTTQAVGSGCFRSTCACGWSGLAIFFLGIAIVYTDLLREGGWPQVGAIIAIMGAIDAVFAPRLLKKQWDEQDRRTVERR